MIQIGHRGASGDLPENSSKAFKAAVEMGLKMIELDVHLTQDDEVVIHHDYNTLRQTGHDCLICQTSFSRLRELDFASYKADYGRIEQIMTLQELFHLVPSDVCVNIEIKYSPLNKSSIAEKVAGILTEYRRESSVIISSFQHEILNRFSEINPKIKLGLLLYSRLIKPLQYIQSLKFMVYSVHLAIELSDKDYIREISNAGYQVYLYTINSLDQFEFAREAGASGVFTDYPGRFAPLIC